MRPSAMEGDGALGKTRMETIADETSDAAIDCLKEPRAAGKPFVCWFGIFRYYGPLEPWFDKTWRPGEIELRSDRRTCHRQQQ
jgi:hypothetical protein